MQKRTKKILSALVALVMVFSILPANVFATGESESVLEKWSITLGDDIGVNFYLRSADYTVEATVDGKAVTPVVSGKVATVNVAAAQMNDPIVLTVKSGSETVYCQEHSVREYAETILGGEYDDYVKNMVLKMLNYGAAAQTYFGHNEEALANTGYEITVSAQVPSEVPAITLTDTLDGIDLYGVSLVFQNKVAVRFYFRVTGDIDRFTFSQGTAVEKDGLYYVEIGGIQPQNLADNITLQVNEGALSVTYSPLTYIIRQYGRAGSSQTLKNLLLTLYAYHLEAKDYSRVVPVGTLQSSTHGWSSGGIYAKMPENDAYYVPDDWGIEYTPVSADVIQLVRGGETYSVGVPGEGTLIKFTATDYYLKTAENTVSGNVLPLQDQDILIINGRFYHPATGNVMYISKTYIYNDGGTLIFSAEAPATATVYPLDALSGHNAGVALDDSGNIKGIYATGVASEATYNTNWSVEYTPKSAENYKLIRDGETYSIGVNGQGTLVMFGQTEFYLKQESHTVAQSDLLPVRDGDILVVEGKWICNQDPQSVLDIAKTYILITNGTAIFSPTEPVPVTVVSGGIMSESPDGWDASGDIFFKLAENSLPVDDNGETEYTAEAGVIRLVRNESTYNMAGAVVKYGNTDYDLVLNESEYLPLQSGDYLIVEGNFANANGYTLSVDKTYILFRGASIQFSDTEPVLEVIHQIGMLSESGNGPRIDTDSNTVTGIYAVAEENDAPYSDWSIEYTPAEASGLKLIRDGVTYDVGVPGSGTIVKFTDRDYFLKLEGHTVKFSSGESVLPMQDNDILIVEGDWQQATNGSVKVCFAKTYILIDGTTVSFSATEPVLTSIYEIGVLGAHTNGVNKDDTAGIKGIYATCAATDATYNTDWSVEYAPASAENYRLIRGGVTYNVGVSNAGTLVLYSQTDIYLKQDNDCMSGGLLPLQDGDILVIEGDWLCKQDETSVIHIATTYISIGKNTASFSADDPRIIQVGTMYAHENGMSGGETISGIYFMTRSNAVPSQADWSVRYAATDTANVKLIRNGTTENIAVVGGNTIVKLSDQAGWLCLENSDVISRYPIMAGDVLVVEGKFQNAANGYAMVIEKTYILIGEDGVSFTTHYAETDFGTVALPTSTDTLTVGTWVGSYHHFTDERLSELRNAGITKLIGVNPAYVGGENNNDVATLLDRCAKYGISVVIDLRDWDGSTVPAYAEHPALIGFLMYDEPSSGDFDTLADLKAKFDSVMPAGKLFYVNLYPECAADASLVGGWNSLIGKDDYDTDYITEFLSKLNIEVLSWDNYSLLKGSGIRTDYYHNFEVMASKGLPLWYTMLSAGHSTSSASYATPTAAELRWQMAVAMTYGVQNIDHYVYYSHEDGYNCMLQNKDGVYSTTALYQDILTVDNEYLAWDNIFMAYSWKGVAGVRAGSSSKMLDMLENNISLTENGVESLSTTQDVLVGVFDHNGDHAYMITNAGSAGSTSVGSGKSFAMRDANVTLTLAEGDYRCVAIISQGTIRYVAVNADNTVDIPVGAYEGVFVIPVKN